MLHALVAVVPSWKNYRSECHHVNKILDNYTHKVHTHRLSSYPVVTWFVEHECLVSFYCTCSSILKVAEVIDFQADPVRHDEDAWGSLQVLLRFSMHTIYS